MNSRELISNKCYTGRYNELPAKHMFLAWLGLHYDELVGHPDDRMDPECNYRGWYMIIAEKVLDSSAPDALKYPAFIINLKQVLLQLVDFHSSDDDEAFTDRVEVVSSYLHKMDVDGLKGMLEALRELIQFHETAQEEIMEPMSSAYDVFSWIDKYQKEMIMEKSKLIASLQAAFDALAGKDFVYHASTRPLLFIQEPYRGTVAMVFLKGITHPEETIKCMDLIDAHLRSDGFEGCIIANDLSTLEINLDEA